MNLKHWEFTSTDFIMYVFVVVILFALGIGLITVNGYLNINKTSVLEAVQKLDATTARVNVIEPDFWKGSKVRVENSQGEHLYFDIESSWTGKLTAVPVKKAFPTKP